MENNDNRVFVARRHLKLLPTKVGVIAHSAILVKIKNVYTLIEYLDDSKVY